MKTAAKSRRTASGAYWDVNDYPAGLAAHHLKEWVQGSAVHPELAAANLQTMQGRAVFEALLGERLERVGGWGKQYFTGEVRRLIEPYEPLAEHGGWWCSGLDPLAEWASMGWGCFKPDTPRQADNGKVIKYEHPAAEPARSFWLKVPSVVAQLNADRFGLPLPAEVAGDRDGSRGEFWRWWVNESRLPIVLTEGAKKAAALLSAGIPAVALAGIWNGCPRKSPSEMSGPKGKPELLADLLAVPLKNRACWVLFDHTENSLGARMVAGAAERLGRLLKRQGAKVLTGAVPAGQHKGADDWLAAGGSWDDLFAGLKPLPDRPVLPQLRCPDSIVPAGRFLAEELQIPPAEQFPLVALAAPMGSGKTELIAGAIEPLLKDGRRVVLITHRRSLGAALAERLGLPWGRDARPGSDLRQLGIALCIDSLCPASAAAVVPGDWHGCTVVIDEVAQVLRHGLMGDGTAVAERRPAVLSTLSLLLAGASQVIVSDAQLSNHVLAALERATGNHAVLIGSEHQPAAGRQLIVHGTRDSWRRELVEQLKAQKRLWVATTAQQAGSPNSAQVLAQLAAEHWPEARVLMVDAESVADPEHDAHRLAEVPDGIAAQYDVVVASPAVAAGLSVTLRGHFSAVMVAAGGTTDPESVAQAAARVRDDCPRHVFAPARSPGDELRVGSGSTDPEEVLKHQHRHVKRIAAQLAGTLDLVAGDAGPWLPLWAEFAATQNAQRLHYRATVRGLLECEGYVVTTAAALDETAKGEADVIDDVLKAIAETRQAVEDDAVAAAELLSDREARELEKRAHKSPAQRAQLARWRVSQAWGIGHAPPSAELLEADRKQLPERARFGWVVQSIEARQLAAGFDQARGRKLNGWAPDLCRELLDPKIAAADAIGLSDWLKRGDWFTATDQQLILLQATAEMHSGDLGQVLGVSPGKRGTGTLRKLLKLCGYRLESHRSRGADGRVWRYRVSPEPLPEGTSREGLETAWRRQLSPEVAV